MIRALREVAGKLIKHKIYRKVMTKTATKAKAIAIDGAFTINSSLPRLTDGGF